MTKTHWKKLINPDYLGAYSFEEGKDMIVTITKVTREKVKGTGGIEKECTIAYLEGLKPMIVNNKNAKNISKAIGSSYIEDWVGKSVSLYPTKEKCFGEIMEVFRVRKQKPAPKKLPNLTPTHKQWAACAKAIASGSYTMKDIRSKYSVTKENEKALCTPPSK